MADAEKVKQLESGLARILARFDTGAKDALGGEIVANFALTPGSSFASQLSRQLNRKLTPDETFKVDVLYRAFKFHDRRNEEAEE